MMSRSSAECRYSFGTCRGGSQRGNHCSEAAGHMGQATDGKQQQHNTQPAEKRRQQQEAHRAEEVHAALVDAQDQLGRQQADGVLNALQGGAGRARRDG